MKRPIIRFPDREIECESISLETTSTKAMDVTFDIEVTAFGVFADNGGGILFFPHSAVHRISASKPNRKRGRPKKEPEKHVPTLVLVEQKGPGYPTRKKN